MDQVDLIWHNGELVAWEDAKVHVLTHGLHYGTGVFEGIRAYETATRAGDLPQSRSPRAAVPVGRALLHADPVHAGGAPGRDARADPRQRLRECYIRPIAFRGYGQMGLFPLDAPVEVSIAAWPWGAYLGEEGKRLGNPREGRELAADPARRADPAREGERPVPEQRAGEDRSDEGRVSGGDPAQPPRVRLRGIGRERLRRPQREDRDPRRPRARSSTGSRAGRSSRSPRTSATRSSSGRSPGRSCTSPTRCS